MLTFLLVYFSRLKVKVTKHKKKIERSGSGDKKGETCSFQTARELNIVNKSSKEFEYTYIDEKEKKKKI